MAGKFTVKGDKGGIVKEVMDFLGRVAQYGRKDITIMAGGGFRTATLEASLVYRGWNTTLSRGMVFGQAALSEANRVKLDAYYVTAKEGRNVKPPEQKKAEQAFLELALMIPSAHKLGKAVDLSETFLTAPMKKVLEKYMQRVPEKGCYHIQHKGSLPNEERIKQEFGIK